jgi:hypothetical protein
MAINDEGRSLLALVFAEMAMLQQAIKRDATREQVLARISLLEADVTALTELFARQDPGLGDAIKSAWHDPARVIANKPT